MDIGKELKEEGQALALEHAGMPWRDHAISLLTRFCKTGPGSRRPFAMEDFRAWALGQGLEQPPSPNAWGALPRIGVREGLMVPTGEYRNAKSPMTRSHPVKIWRSTYIRRLA